MADCSLYPYIDHNSSKRQCQRVERLVSADELSGLALPRYENVFFEILWREMGSGISIRLLALRAGGTGIFGYYG